MLVLNAPVAQGIEQRIPNPCAAGSNPARRTSSIDFVNLTMPINKGFQVFLLVTKTHSVMEYAHLDTC